MSTQDMQKIKYDILLKYNKQVDQLEYTSSGPIKVKMASQFNFKDLNDMTDPSSKIPIDFIISQDSVNRTVAYLIR
jgi:dihydroorotate dehydrogenase